MAAGIVYHNITTAAGVTFSLACWVPDTAAPDVGAIPISMPVKSDGTTIFPTALGAGGGLKVDGSGTALPVSLATLPALVAGSAAIGKLAANSGVDIGDVDVTSSALPTGAATSANQTTIIGHVDGIETLLTTQAGYLDGLETAIASSNTKLDTIITNSSGATPAGTNNIGDVDVLTVPADPFGVNADAGSTTGSISAKLKFIAATGIPITGTVTVGSHAVTNAGTFAVQSAGAVAHDGADSGNPIKIGGRARSTEIAAVASDDRVDFVSDLAGKQIVLPYANPENFVSGAITTAMTGTTTTSLVAAPAAGLRNYLTTIIVSNAHATVGTDIVIQDGSGGTSLMTIPAAAVYGGAVITLPVPLRQPTTATAIFCANVTTGASTKVSAVGYKGS